MTQDERTSLLDELAESGYVVGGPAGGDHILVSGPRMQVRFSLNQSPAKIKQAVTDMGLEPFQA